MSERESNLSNQAVECFKSGFSCSQAVLSTFCERQGMDRDLALNVSCAFGGGIASTGNICGAVSGGLMAIGLKYGRHTIEDLPAKDKTYEISRQYMNEFKARHGSIICKEILGCDLNTPEGKAEFKNKDLFNVACIDCVRDSAMILEKLL